MSRAFANPTIQNPKMSSVLKVNFVTYFDRCQAKPIYAATTSYKQVYIRILIKFRTTELMCTVIIVSYGFSDLFFQKV